MKNLVVVLMNWIAANSGYETEGIPLPEVVAMTPAELTAEFYSGAGLSASKRPAVDPRVLALYDREAEPAGRIYIIAPELTEGATRDARPTENPIFQERLLHELVHHVQHHTGAYETYLCPAQGERDAYALGGEFLRERQVADPLSNRQFWAQIYSRC